ncbi:MAG: ExeA family protein [Pirellula sp.]|jgi:type II secretory pathway predicted ATPase ExeA
MYETFFGFDKRPFLTVPTLDRYFPASSIEQAYQTASRCIHRGEGPVAIIGGTGLGKTMCCLRIADSFRKSFEVVMLASSQICTRRALLQSLLYELRLPYREKSEGELRLTLMNRLQSFTESQSEALVLVVDEAQTLVPKLLDELRLLTNIVRNGVPRVRLVLCGTMKLEDILSHPQMESLNQRLAARCYLTPLGMDETARYVQHKVELCGVNIHNAMTRDAIDALYRGSDGIPRLIDQLADQAFLQGAAERIRPISAALISQAWCILQQLPNPWSEPSVPADRNLMAPSGAYESGTSPVAPYGNISPKNASNPLSFEQTLPSVDAVRLTAQGPATTANTDSSVITGGLQNSRSLAPNDSNSIIEFGSLEDEDFTVEESHVRDAVTPERSVTLHPAAALEDNVRDMASIYSVPGEISRVNDTTPLGKPLPPIGNPEVGRVEPQIRADELLTAYNEDFDEEFTIPVQSSKSYQSYSGMAYGNLNHDTTLFASIHRPHASMAYPDAENFLEWHRELDPGVNPVVPELGPDRSESDEYVSNLSEHSFEEIEQQIEEEMRDLVSNMNMSAITIDPNESFAGRICTLSDSTELVLEDSPTDGFDSFAESRRNARAESGFSSGPTAQHAVVESGDDRDVIVVEEDAEVGAATATRPNVATGTRVKLHPYAQLFAKLRQS